MLIFTEGKITMKKTSFIEYLIFKMKYKGIALAILFFAAALVNAQQIGSGLGNYTLIINNGKVYASGDNYFGELGNGTTDNVTNHRVVDTTGVLAGKKIIAVATGSDHSLALDSDGRVYSWGYNFSGRLGVGPHQDSNVPLAVDTTGVLAGKKIIAIAAGYDHSLALDSNGKVYAWGANDDGQLGNNSESNSLVPVAVNTTGVLAGKKIIAIAAGKYFSLALASDGKVYAWGDNWTNQLGNRTSSSSSDVPAAVDTTGALAGKTVTAIAAGSGHCLALASDGTVYGWGAGQSGQIGNGSKANTHVPSAVMFSGKKMTAIAAGGNFSLAVDSNGTVYSWGYGTDGELGNGKSGSYTDYTSIIPVCVDTTGVLAGKKIIAVAAGFKHSIALGSDGTVYTWGANDDGQLGNGTTTKSDVPVVSFKINLGTATAVVKSNNNIPGRFMLEQNYPNPFNPTTTISYALPHSSKVVLRVFNMLGKEAATLVNSEQSAGVHNVVFNASNLASGVYIYRLSTTSGTGNFTQTKKLVLMK